MEMDGIAHHQIEGRFRQGGAQPRLVGDGEALHGLGHQLVGAPRQALPAQRIEDGGAQRVGGAQADIAEGVEEGLRAFRRGEILDPGLGPEPGAPVERPEPIRRQVMVGRLALVAEQAHAEAPVLLHVEKLQPADHLLEFVARLVPSLGEACRQRA